MDVCYENVSIDREMSDGRQWDTVLIFFYFFLKISNSLSKIDYLVTENLKFAVMRTNSNINVITTFPRVALSFFFAPLSFAKGVKHKLKNKYTKIYFS